MSESNIQRPAMTNLLATAEQAMESANNQIASCTEAIRVLGPKVRAIAMKTIDMLLSYPTQDDIDRRKVEVVKQYSTLLYDFTNNMEGPLEKLNLSWMTVEQAMGFYLLSSGRDSDADPQDLRKLIDGMIDAQQQVPLAKSDISNLSAAIKGSAGGLHGLEDSIESATCTLQKLSEELDHGYAVFNRQIILAERLHELLLSSR